MPKPSKKVLDNIKPVVINNINDIRMAIVPFIKEVRDNKVNIQSDVVWTDEDDKKHTTNVESYSSDPSMRRGLLEAFEHVKEQRKLWSRIHGALEDDEYGSNFSEVNIDNVPLPVDKIIEKRLGGKREGLTIVWDLSDRRVVFDPYTKELKEYSL